MRLTEITYGTAQAIEGYGPGFFRVGGHVLRGAVLVTPWDAGAWGGLTDTAGLTPEQTALANRLAQVIARLPPETVASLHAVLDATTPQPRARLRRAAGRN